MALLIWETYIKNEQTNKQTNNPNKTKQNKTKNTPCKKMTQLANDYSSTIYLLKSEPVASNRHNYITC